MRSKTNSGVSSHCLLQELCIAALFLFALGASQGVTKTWTGSTNSNWNTGSNWGGTAPASTDIANIPGGLTNYPIINNTVTIGTNYRTTIASAHAYVEPFALLEIGLKYALKNSFEIYDALEFSTVTDFILVRPQYDLTNWLNVAGEMRMLRQRGANDLKVGYSAEAGVVAMKNMIVAAGYNFQAYKDRDLVDYIYSVAGPYITFRMKFTEEIFGGESANQD